jgi:hypothetical protein
MGTYAEGYYLKRHNRQLSDFAEVMQLSLHNVHAANLAAQYAITASQKPGGPRMAVPFPTSYPA